MPLLLLLSRFSHVQLHTTPPGSPVPGMLQARILEWVAISFSNAWKWKVKVKSLSRLLATPWTATYQVPLSMGFSRQEYWSGLSCPCRGPKRTGLTNGNCRPWARSGDKPLVLVCQAHSGQESTKISPHSVPSVLPGITRGTLPRLPRRCPHGQWPDVEVSIVPRHTHHPRWPSLQPPTSCAVRKCFPPDRPLFPDPPSLSPCYPWPWTPIWLDTSYFIDFPEISLDWFPCIFIPEFECEYFSLTWEGNIQNEQLKSATSLEWVLCSQRHQKQQLQELKNGGLSSPYHFPAGLTDTLMGQDPPSLSPVH